MNKKYISPKTEIEKVEPYTFLAASIIRGGDTGNEGDRAESKEFSFEESIFND